jgi:hypothetical protein
MAVDARLMDPVGGAAPQTVVVCGTRAKIVTPGPVAVPVTELPVTQTAAVAVGHGVVPVTRKPLQLEVHAGGFAGKDAVAGVTGAAPGVPVIVWVAVKAA